MKYTIWTEYASMSEEDYAVMDWKEAEAFLRHVVTRIPERVEKLTSFIRATPGFKGWKPNSSATSLKQLGVWLLKKITHRQIAPEDIRYIPNSPSVTSEILEEWKQRAEPEYELTEWSTGLMCDVGFLIAKLLHEKNLTTMWIRCKNRRIEPYTFNAPILYYDKQNGFQPNLSPHMTMLRLIDTYSGKPMNWKENCMLRLFRVNCAEAKYLSPERKGWKIPEWQTGLGW